MSADPRRIRAASAALSRLMGGDIGRVDLAVDGDHGRAAVELDRRDAAAVTDAIGWRQCPKGVALEVELVLTMGEIGDDVSAADTLEERKQVIARASSHRVQPGATDEGVRALATDHHRATGATDELVVGAATHYSRGAVLDGDVEDAFGFLDQQITARNGC